MTARPREVSAERSYELISLNDHVVVPPDAYTSRVARRFADRVPRVVAGAGVDAAAFMASRGIELAVLDDDGSADDPRGPGDAWCYDGQLFPTSYSSVSPEYQDFDMRHIGSFHYADLEPHYLEAKARASVMDDEGILASGLYPQVDFPSYAGVHLLRSDDSALAGECARAYNDFLLEEWSDAAPGRFIPLILLPLRDPGAAAAEIRRTAALGAKGITFPEDPAKLGLPGINADDWNPVFDAVQETGLPLCVHNASSLWMPPLSRDGSVLTPAVMLASMATMTFYDWIFSNVFVRFPSLRMVQNECDVGWIPWALQRCDVQWERNHAYRAPWNTASPSDLFGRNMFACALPYETDTADVVARIGADGLLMETDYPHLDMSFPHTQSMVRENLGALSDADLAQVLRGNAARLFNVAL